MSFAQFTSKANETFIIEHLPYRLHVILNPRVRGELKSLHSGTSLVRYHIAKKGAPLIVCIRAYTLSTFLTFFAVATRMWIWSCSSATSA